MFGYHLSIGTEFLGTVCPGGPEVGNRKSWDQMGSGPIASQPYIIEYFHDVLNENNVSCLIGFGLFVSVFDIHFSFSTSKC